MCLRAEKKLTGSWAKKRHGTGNFQGDYPFVWHTRDVCHEKFTQKLKLWFFESWN